MEAPKKSNESLLNRAYGWFAFLGLATLPVGVGCLLSIMHWVNFDESSDWGILPELFGLTLALPLLAGMVWARIYGIQQTVRFRHLPLVVLSVISIAFLGLMILLPTTPAWDADPVPPILGYEIGISLGIYIAGNILIPAWWFTRGRRHYRAKTLARH
ncbi:MAG: hypothetical protein ACLQBD_21780 [Syntrophobacteraceae bacterium]